MKFDVRKSFEYPKTKRQKLQSRRMTRKNIFADFLQESVSNLDPLQKRLEEIFSLFDSGNKGEIDIRELGTVVRALGCVVTETELEEIQKELEDVQNNCIPQHHFVEFMHKAIGEQKYKPADADTLLQAFKHFDPENRGYVMKDDIEKAITEYGESFTLEELHDMMNIACDPKTGRINYEHYMNLLIEKIPSDKNVYHLYEIAVLSEKFHEIDFASSASDEF